MNEKIRNLWMRTISGTMCRLTCDECREVLGKNFDGCPLDAVAEKEDIYNFIRLITDMLYKKIDLCDYDLPFPVELTADDIVSVIMEAANEC